MKVEAKVLCPDFFRAMQYCEGPSSYQPIMDSFGNIILQVDDNDYQGDSRLLYREDDRIGFLQFGWGSCSGCDSLQACHSY